MILTYQEPIAHLRAAARTLMDARDDRVKRTVDRLHGEPDDAAIEAMINDASPRGLAVVLGCAVEGGAA